MLINNIQATVLKVSKKEGIGRVSQKPYKFFVATVVDTDANVFAMNVDDTLVKSEENIAALLDLRNEDCSLEIKFYPAKNFGISATITRISEPSK